MYIRSYCNAFLDDRLESLYSVEIYVVAEGAVLNNCVWAYLAVLADNGLLADDSSGEYLSACAYLNVSVDNDAVCADELNTVGKVLADDFHSCVVVQCEEILSVVCALDDISVLGLVSACVLAFLDSEEDSVGQVILLLCVVAGDLAEERNEVGSPEPVSA